MKRSTEKVSSGYVRPLRLSYIHAGRPGPKYPLKKLTADQIRRFGDEYSRYEPYPASCHPISGRYWTEEQLAAVGDGCKAVTHLTTEIAETYAADPNFFGHTWCAGCCKHFPLAEFVWDGTDERVGS